MVQRSAKPFACGRARRIERQQMKRLAFLLTAILLLGSSAVSQQVFFPVYSSVSDCVWPVQYITVLDGMAICPINPPNGTPTIALAIAQGGVQGAFSIINQGPKGDPGGPGQAATVSVGSTTTGAPGSQASVTNSGSSSQAVFNFTVPQGEQGIPGPAGIVVGTVLTVNIVCERYWLDTGWLQF